MREIKKLNKIEIQQRIVEMDAAWLVKGKFLQREFLFKDFVEAFSFMTAVALKSEKFGHHPNWTNTYNKLTINLSTHDVDAISTKDFDLAKAIDLLVQKHSMT